MATGNTLYAVDMPTGHPPATLYPTFNVRNGMGVWEFAATGTTTIIFRGVAPSHYTAGGFTVKLHWYGATATTGSVVWGAAVERGTTDIDADSFGSQVTATTACSGTSGIESVSSINLAGNMDAIVAGDAFRLQIQRLGDNGSDDMAGLAQLYTLEVIET